MRGADDSGHTHESACLNCGTALVGAHCHACGQQAHLHRTLGAFGHDLLHGVFHFEGKVWRTLPLLAWRPGQLTRRYIAGERARFVSPLALFLFTIFLTFAVMGNLGSAQGNEMAASGLATADARIAGLREQRAAAVSRGDEVAEIDAAIERDMNARDWLAATNGFPTLRPVIDLSFKTGWHALDKGIEKANKNPSLLFYKLKSNGYKYSWLLIPLSLPFLWLLFLNRRRYRTEFGAYDHVVFITYSITFFSLVAIALALLSAAGVPMPLLMPAMLVLLPVHLFRQLRGAYELRWVSALWRTLALLGFGTLVLGLFLLILLVMGVMG